MPELSEANLAELRESASRVETLEAERDSARAERDTARSETQTVTNRETARGIIHAADHSFTALETRGLLSELPVTDAGALNVDTFTATVTESAAEAAKANGAGSIRGFGHTEESDKDSLDTYNARFAAQKGA